MTNLNPDDPEAIDAAAGVSHRVIGTTMPVLEIDLEAGQKVVSVGGEMSWKIPSVQLTTTTSGLGGSGVMGVLKRVAGGGSIFLTEYCAQGGPGSVFFATKMPGEIRPIAIAPDREYLVHRHGFLAATDGVGISVGFQQRFGSGIFGGTGFILQRVAGNGTAWIELSGELVEYHLGPGERIQVHPGHVGLFDANMEFGIERIKGIRNMLGADSIFLASITGPGLVWLQTLPIAGLAHALQPYLEADNGGGGNGGGGLARGLGAILNQ